MQVESETVKARSPLAASSRPGIADLDASSAPGPSRLGQPRRSAYAEPEEDAEQTAIGAEGSAQHADADVDGTGHHPGPDADSIQSNKGLGGQFRTHAVTLQQ